MKHFCPWCDLELEGNKPRDGHINEFAAWEKSECEYYVGAHLDHHRKNHPVSEYEREADELKIMEANRRHLTRSIKASRINVARLKKEFDLIASPE